MTKLDCVELQNKCPNSKMSLLVKLLDGPAKPWPFLLGMSTIALLTSMLSSSSFGANVLNKILPGITHWQSPKFFGYYPFNVSTAAGSLGETLSVGVNFTGFSWIAFPVVTELEIIVFDSLGKLLHLPEEFLSSGNATYTIYILHWIAMSYNSMQYLQIFFIFLLQLVGLWGRLISSQFCSYFPLRAVKSWIAGKGGGVIQGTSSEAVLVVMLAGRNCVLKKVCTSQGMSEAEALTN